jgi:transcriptional regulator with XRE-family HTH domain
MKMDFKIPKNADFVIEQHLVSCRIRIGENIREIREKKGLNQETLAEIMNVSRTTISKIESGKFNCSIDYLAKFSWFLGFDVLFKVKEK